jgi:adenylosuccinate synthase
VLTSLISEHNKYSEWQGPVRYGWFDKVLAQYALDRTGGVDAFALTHIDLLQHLETWKYCTGYKNYNDLNGLLVDMNISDGVLGSLHVPRFLSLDQRAHLTQALSTVVPLLETCEVEEKSVIRKIESLIGHSVDIISRGPSTENVQILNSFPA